MNEEERRRRNTEKAARYRARKRGEEVPMQKPGPKPGYQQSADHVEKRKRSGPEHHAWLGDEASERAGRSRALRRYDAQCCTACGADRAERHHVDGNTLNNEPDNIAILCRRCHMQHDGRLAAFTELARVNQPKAVRERWR